MFRIVLLIHFRSCAVDCERPFSLVNVESAWFPGIVPACLSGRISTLCRLTEFGTVPAAVLSDALLCVNETCHH